jgi:hypothetical protein
MVMEIDRITEWEEVKKHARVVAKAWADPEFKERLLARPREVLVEHGFDVPVGTEVAVVESNEGTVSTIGDVIYFTLPEEPADGLGDEYLAGTGLVSPQAGCFCAQTSAPFSHGPQTSGMCSGPPCVSSACC